MQPDPRAATTTKAKPEAAPRRELGLPRRHVVLCVTLKTLATEERPPDATAAALKKTTAQSAGPAKDAADAMERLALDTNALLTASLTEKLEDEHYRTTVADALEKTAGRAALPRPGAASRARGLPARQVRLPGGHGHAAGG